MQSYPYTDVRVNNYTSVMGAFIKLDFRITYVPFIIFSSSVHAFFQQDNAKHILHILADYKDKTEEEEHTGSRLA